MDPDEVDLAAINLRKDAVIAAYAANVARWQGVLGAGVGSLLVVLAAHASGGLQRDAAGPPSGLALGLILISAVMIRIHEHEYAQSVRALRKEIERLKRRKAP